MQFESIIFLSHASSLYSHYRINNVFFLTEIKNISCELQLDICLMNFASVDKEN